MKSFFKLIILVILTVFTAQRSEAQFLKRLAKKAQEKIEREADRRAEKRINKGIDKVYDEVEDEIDGKNNHKTKKSKEKEAEKENDTEEKNIEKDKEESKKEKKENSEEEKTAKEEEKVADHEIKVSWNRFDFVPGDTVLFEDAPSADEENGEFPSRWDLYQGSAEIGEVDGQNVIMFIKNSSYIVPYLKNSKEDYLPDIFTLELDVYFPKRYSTRNRLWIYLGDKKNNNRSDGAHKSLVIMPHSLEFEKSGNNYPGTEKIGWSVEKTGSWKHISIAYTKGKFKAYMDDTRLVNIPHLEVNPTGITINSGGDNIYIKNIRIAKGGVKYYDRVLTEGKIIINGIKFDVNKATLKPESMGPINKIYKMMQKNADLNFSVEGHTDSDGSEEANLALSKQRGKAVMEKLISMGIDADRLKYDGFGESKPIDNNSTPEGKANNRRVEFVKF